MKSEATTCCRETPGPWAGKGQGGQERPQRSEREVDSSGRRHPGGGAGRVTQQTKRDTVACYHDKAQKTVKCQEASMWSCTDRAWGMRIRSDKRWRWRDADEEG